jgi:hypothetical protein
MVARVRVHGDQLPFGHLAELSLSRYFRNAVSSKFQGRSCLRRDDKCYHFTSRAGCLQPLPLFALWQARSAKRS